MKVDFEMDVDIFGIPCTAKAVSYYEGYKGDRETPPEAPEMEWELCFNGQRVVEMEERMTEDECREIEEKLINAYWGDIADRRAEDKLNRILGK